jgi:hypothetical protein
MSKISINLGRDKTYRPEFKIGPMPIPDGLRQLDNILKQKYGTGIQEIIDGAGPKRNRHQGRVMSPDVDPEIRRIMRRRRGI